MTARFLCYHRHRLCCHGSFFGFNGLRFAALYVIGRLVFWEVLCGGVLRILKEMCGCFVMGGVTCLSRTGESSAEEAERLSGNTRKRYGNSHSLLSD